MATLVVVRGSEWSTRTAQGAPTPPRRRHRVLRGSGGRRSTPTTRSATWVPRTWRRTRRPPSPPDHRRACDPQRVAELCPRDWVAARQQSFQRRSFDGAGQAEAGCLVSRPHSRHLARSARQVAGVVRRRRCRRRGVDRGHPQHQTRHPIARSGTCLQNQIGRTPTTILNISMSALPEQPAPLDRNTAMTEGAADRSSRHKSSRARTTR